MRWFHSVNSNEHLLFRHRPPLICEVFVRWHRTNNYGYPILWHRLTGLVCVRLPTLKNGVLWAFQEVVVYNLLLSAAGLHRRVFNALSDDTCIGAFRTVRAASIPPFITCLLVAFCKVMADVLVRPIT